MRSEQVYYSFEPDEHTLSFVTKPRKEAKRERPAMKNILRLFTFIVTLVGCVAMAEAQQPGKVYRIGYLRAETPPEVDIEAFSQGLREHGYP